LKQFPTISAHPLRVALWQEWEKLVKTIIEKARTEKLLKIVDDQVGARHLHGSGGSRSLLIEGQHTGIFHITNRGIAAGMNLRKNSKECLYPEVTVKPIKSMNLRDPQRPHYSSHMPQVSETTERS